MASTPDVPAARASAWKNCRGTPACRRSARFFGQAHAVDAGGVERGDVVGGNAAHAFQGERAFLRCDDRPPRARTGRPLPAKLRRSRLALAFPLQVQLVAQGGFDLAHPSCGGSCRHWGGSVRPAAARRAAGPRHGSMRAAMPGAAPSPPLLARSRPGPAAHQRGRVHLGDRGRGQRRVVEMAYSRSTGAPARLRWRACCRSGNGTWSRSRVSSRPRRRATGRGVERICPNLTKIGPARPARCRQARRATAPVARRRRSNGAAISAAGTGGRRRPGRRGGNAQHRGIRRPGAAGCAAPSYARRTLARVSPIGAGGTRAPRRSAHSRSVSTLVEEGVHSSGATRSRLSSTRYLGVSHQALAAFAQAPAGARAAPGPRRPPSPKTRAKASLDVRAVAAGFSRRARQFGVAGDLHFARRNRRLRRRHAPQRQGSRLPGWRSRAGRCRRCEDRRPTRSACPDSTCTRSASAASSAGTGQATAFARRARPGAGSRVGVAPRRGVQTNKEVLPALPRPARPETRGSGCGRRSWRIHASPARTEERVASRQPSRPRRSAASGAGGRWGAVLPAGTAQPPRLFARRSPA